MNQIHPARLAVVAALGWLLVQATPLAAQELLAFEPDDTIAELRAKIAHNGYQFTVRENRIFQMSPDARGRMLSRHAPPAGKRSAVSADPGPLAAQLGRALPATFDWRNVNGHTYIGPIRDQGNCGSCYAFAACAAAEGVYNVALGKYDSQCVDFSEAFVAFCLSAYYSGFSGCSGADYDYDELAALTAYGVCLESLYPYSDHEQACIFATLPATTRFKNWYRIACSDIDAIKTAIMTYGVVDAAVYVDSGFEAYDSGIYENTATDCNDTPCYYKPTNHAIALVGWGDGYWILRNSWGPDWGENGYMRIKFTSARAACEVAYLVYGLPGPVPVTGPASNITATAAKLTGSVSPNGQNTVVYFDYGTATNYDLASASVAAGSGTGTVPVSVTVTSLYPETTYHFRLRAITSAGATQGADRVFTTVGLPGPPLVTALPATQIGPTTALMRAWVNPHGLAGAGWFEYGFNPAYGRRTAAITFSAQSSNVLVQALATGLYPRVGYHYRFTATNSAGLHQGLDQAFTTAVATVVVLHETFEHSGAAPGGWSQDYVTGSRPWSFMNGGLNGHPAGAQAGTYNACFYVTNFTAPRTRLVTPTLDFGAATNAPELTFWHAMQVRLVYQDELRVYYKTSAAGSWTLLAAYTTNTPAWTQRSLSLPKVNRTYYLAFEGTARWGYGACVDEVYVTGQSAPPPGVVTLRAEGQTTNSARLVARITPDGLPGRAWFEYGPSPLYGLATTNFTWAAGLVSVTATVHLGGLPASTTYYFRARGTNVNGLGLGENCQFTTRGAPKKPTATTLPTAPVTLTTARLNAQVTPHWLDTTCYFLYGTNQGQLTATPTTLLSNTNPAALTTSATVTGLRKGTRYYIRPVAYNSLGSSTGITASFVTGVKLPPALFQLLLAH